MEFISELSETTGIAWWDENRRKINEAIHWYNEFIEKRNRTPEMILAKVDQIRKFRGEGHNFSDWQLEILDDIEHKIRDLE